MLFRTPKRPIRTLFVSHLSGWGGAEHFLLQLVTRLDRKRFDPVVALPSDGPLRAKLIEAGIPIVNYTTSWWVGGDQAASRALYEDGLDGRIAYLARTMTAEHIELVVTNTTVSSEGAYAAERLGLPHVWILHELATRIPALTPLVPPDEFYRTIHKLSRRVFTVSNAMKREIQRHDPDMKIDVIHNGIAGVAECRDMKRDERPTVLFVGALTEHKGIETFGHAMPLVLASRPETRFVFVGGANPDGIAWRNRILSSWLAPHVEFIGPRATLDEFYAWADLFAFPSMHDAFPLVVLEAMSAGLPVVAANNGGIPEQVVHGKTGLLVDPTDAQAFASAIVFLLNDDHHRKLMGVRGKERWQKYFTLERWARNWNKALSLAAQ